MSENPDDTTLSQLTLFAGDSPARMSAPQGSARASKKARGRDSGSSLRASFASLHPDGSWLKMCRGCYQLTLEGQWERYCETWPRAGMMRSGIAYRQPRLVPHTSVTGYSSLPTPTASRYGTNQGGGMGRVGPVRPSLESMGRTGLWPTPTAGDGARGQNVYDGKRGQSLIGAARGQMWPTPRANDALKRGNIANDPRSGLPAAVRHWPTPRANERGQHNSRDEGMALSRAVKLWPTPTASDATGGPAYSKPPGRQGGFLLKEVVPGQLNPTWDEWLMGFPLGWTELES